MNPRPASRAKDGRACRNIADPAGARASLRRVSGLGLVLALALALAGCARSESAHDASTSVAEGIDQQSRDWDAAERKAGRLPPASRGPEEAPAEPAPAR